MNQRKLVIRRIDRIVVLGVAGTLGACASAPPAPEMSILDVIDNRERIPVGPSSCAALNVAAVCEKSTRFDSGRNCLCVDPSALTDPRFLRF